MLDKETAAGDAESVLMMRERLRERCASSLLEEEEYWMHILEATWLLASKISANASGLEVFMFLVLLMLMLNLSILQLNLDIDKCNCQQINDAPGVVIFSFL